jgi:hypothetical protein
MDARLSAISSSWLHAGRKVLLTVEIVKMQIKLDQAPSAEQRCFLAIREKAPGMASVLAVTTGLEVRWRGMLKVAWGVKILDDHVSAHLPLLCLNRETGGN